jgi:predicted nucleic acid-binding protein
MMRVYLDTSVYNRPYDDQKQIKVNLETQAILIILNLIETKQIESFNSSVLEYENHKNPFPIIRKSIKQYLNKTTLFQPLNETIRKRAKQLETQGIKAIDSLHIASFEASGSDDFITCDKRLINRCKTLNIKAINPIDFIQELENEN